MPDYSNLTDPNEEPVYWSGEPERIRLAKDEPSPVIVIHHQRVLARAAWLGMVAVLALIIALNWLPPYHQSNMRMMIRAIRESGAHVAQHPRMLVPLVMAGTMDAVGLYERAVRNYNVVLEIDPEFAWGYYGRGSAFRAMGSPASSINDLTTAIDLDSSLVWAYNMRGLVYRDSIQNFDAARFDFQEAVIIDPEFAWAHVNLARLHTDPMVSLDHFNTAIALGLGKRPEVYVHRANTYIRMNRFEEALADFDHAESLDPRFPWTHFYRPRAYEPLGDIDSAIASYERFLVLYTEQDANTAHARSEIRRLLGDDFFSEPPDDEIEGVHTRVPPTLTPSPTPSPMSISLSPAATRGFRLATPSP